MSAFQKAVLLNKEVLAVFKDTSGFDAIAMVADGSPAAASSTPSTRNAAAVPSLGAGEGEVAGSCSVSVVPGTTPYHGSSNCTIDKTFGCSARTSAGGHASVWVSGDCRAVFKCDTAPAVICESWSHGNVSCPCVHTQVWARPLVNATAAAVALFNPGEVAQDMEVR